MKPIALEMFSGDDKSFKVGPVLDEDGAVIDITGLDLTFAVSDARNGEAVFAKTTPDGIVIAAGSGGLATIVIDAADTVTLAEQFFWTLVIVDAEDKRATLAAGTLLIRPSIAVLGS